MTNQRTPKFIAGGADNATNSEASTRTMRYPCAAHQCPMPGTIFLGGSREGACAWHALENPRHWPRITQAILDWQCVQQAINRMQRAIVAPETCADAAAQDAAMDAEWRWLLPYVRADWAPRLQPGTGESPTHWAYRMRMFLGARIKESVGGGKGAGTVDESAPTPLVAQVRAGLRGAPPADWTPQELAA